MADRFKSGDPVKVMLSKKHTLAADDEMVEHAAKFVRYLPDEWAEVELDSHHSIDAGRKVFTLSVPISQLVAAVLLLFLFVAPANAQFLGYTSPQTVNAKVFSGQTTAAVTPSSFVNNCAPTNGAPCSIPNIGQSIHSVTYSISSPCTVGFFMDLRLEASNDGTNWFSISQDGTDQNSGSVQGSSSAGLTAIGSYAGYRLNLVSISCLNGGTPSVTAFYSGTSTSAPAPADLFYQSNPYRKLILQNQPTTNAVTQPAVTIGAPNGNTAGALYISCFIAANGSTTSCPAAMTVTVTGFIAFGASIGGGGGGNITSKFQSYGINPTVAPVTAIFSSPAISITFSFGGTGTAGVSWSIYYLSNSTPSSNFVADPCATSGAVKQAFSTNITTGATTLLVLGVTQQTVYVCGISLDMTATAATADTIFFEQGSGATCTTPSTLSATFSSGLLSAGATVIPIGSGTSTILSGTTGFSLCAVSAVGTTPNIALHFVYVQQ